MYFYHGNKHYYLSRIFLNDKELQEAVYVNGLTGSEEFELFAYSLADELTDIIEKYLIDTNLSATEFYDKAYDAYTKNSDDSKILSSIQTAIYLSYGKTYGWYYPHNKNLYVSILKSALYGSIKHFFFENRDKYLPQYDWYLINQNQARKDIMEMLFREFDKLTTVAEAIQHYQDPDDIPYEFSIYLQEITGLTMNNYGGTFTDLQLRSLTKHLVEVWREKGALFSIELFFSCMGIDCDVQELWFDRRLYSNPESFNDYTKVQNKNSFGYYLTPLKPHATSYNFSSETIDYSDYTQPCSSRIWDREINNSSDKEETLRQLLGYDAGEQITYTFFKSNYLLINFSYIGQNKTVSKDELAIYKDLLNHVLPLFIRVYYGNEYESTFGNEQWDIFKWYNPVDNGSQTYGTYVITDENGNERPAEIFDLFDTNSNGDKYFSKVVVNFVSGTGTFAEEGEEWDQTDFNDMFDPNEETCQAIIVVDDLSLHDIITGNFYNSEHSYTLNNENVLTRDDNIVGTLEIAVENKIAHYYFKVNDSREEIYPSSGIEPQIPCDDTFATNYTNDYLNLFESSSWKTDINAYNDLYDGETWIGDIQYEYSRYTNPLESLEAVLTEDGGTLTITLI